AEEIRGRAESVEAREVEHSERTRRGYAIENEIAENRQALHALEVETERAIGRRAANQERCAELDARSAAAAVELERAQAHSQSWAWELESTRRFAESAAEEVAKAQHEWQMRQQEAQGAAASLADVERQQEARRQSVLEVMSSGAQVRNQITQADEHMTALDREAQRLEREMAAAQVDIENFGGKRGQIAFEFESVNQTVSALNTRITEVRGEIESKRKQEEETKKHLDGLRAEFASALGKRS